MKPNQADLNLPQRLTPQRAEPRPRSAKLFLAAVLLGALAGRAGAQTYELSGTWLATNGTPNSHLATGDVNRGLAYGTVSNEVFVANKGVTGSGTTPAVDVLDGATGAVLGSAEMTGVSGGTFWLDQIAVADDGVLYGANLTTAVGSNPYRLYRWANWASAPDASYAGDPTGGVTVGKRLGDNLAITGSGTNTLVLTPVESGAAPSTNVVLFSTMDGTNFNPTLLEISGLPAVTGGPAFGIAFYTNNTFLFKPNGASMYLVQFPANFASLASPVGAVVLATNAFSGNYVLLSYHPAARLLATVIPASSGATAINLYRLADFAAGPVLLASTNLASPNANGNLTGGVALGGPGQTNAIYALDSNNGIQASAITFAAGAIPPTVTTQPAGGTVYTNIPSFTFTVVASGSQPLSYQWQFNTVSNLLTATNIAGATNASYSLTYPATSASGWYDVVITNVAGATSSVPVQLTVVPPTSSVAVTQLWTLAPEARPYLGGAGTYDTRGLAYDPKTETVLVADKNAGSFGIFVLDANTGADRFTLNTAGVGTSGNIFPLDQVGVADDGVVYAGNLATEVSGNQSDFGLISWASVDSNAVPYLAYTGDPGNGSGDRWGDTMAVRGTGANTEILLGSYLGYLGGPATNVALLTTTDGQNFTATTLTIADVPRGFAGLGIAFGAGNTFWAKSPGFDLRQVAFNPGNGTGTVIADYPAASSGISSFTSMSAIGVDPVHNILAGVTFNDIPNDLALYQLSTNGTPPYLFDQKFFPSLNGNIQENGATAVKFPRVYSLDVNNGIIALSYGVPPSTLPAYRIEAVAYQSGPAVVLTWQSVAGHSYQVQSTSGLQGSGTVWVNLGAPLVATNSTASYTDSSPGGSVRFYRIQGQ